MHYSPPHSHAPRVIPVFFSLDKASKVLYGCVLWSILCRSASPSTMSTSMFVIVCLIETANSELVQYCTSCNVTVDSLLLINVSKVYASNASCFAKMPYTSFFFAVQCAAITVLLQAASLGANVGPVRQRRGMSGCVCGRSLGGMIKLEVSFALQTTRACNKFSHVPLLAQDVDFFCSSYSRTRIVLPPLTHTLTQAWPFLTALPCWSHTQRLTVYTRQLMYQNLQYTVTFI